MPIDSSKSPYATFSSERSAPATRAKMLQVAMLSDTVDLSTYAKAIECYNIGSADVVIRVTPELEASDDAADAVRYTLPAGSPPRLIPLGVRRIWSTGSTGLAAALAAETVEVVLYTL